MIKAIIGLGNPGPSYYYQRHSIGFRVLDALALEFQGTWHTKGQAETCSIIINENPVMLVKPQTFMNSSGTILPPLLKKGIRAENILVVHDELEKPFGSLTIKSGGSHKGHNGLKSIINQCGDQFMRMRFGIGRPECKEDVPMYVLQPFKESQEEIATLIASCVQMIIKLFNA